MQLCQSGCSYSSRGVGAAHRAWVSTLIIAASPDGSEVCRHLARLTQGSPASSFPRIELTRAKVRGMSKVALALRESLYRWSCEQDHAIGLEEALAGSVSTTQS